MKNVGGEVKESVRVDMPWKQKALNRWAIASNFNAIWLRVDDGLGDLNRHVDRVVGLVELEINREVLRVVER